MLFSSALGTWAQQRIKEIDITIETPEVGAPIWNEELGQVSLQVKSIITDAFGSQNMLGEDKIAAEYVQVTTFDDFGNRIPPFGIEGEPCVYEAGRKYLIIVHIANLTNVLFNYKNDKNLTTDNSTVKATINGQKANITSGVGSPFDMRIAHHHAWHSRPHYCQRRCE